MTPMVATSIVPHLGRLACAYFHTSAHPSDNLGGKSVDRLRMSPDPHFIAVRRNTDRYQMLRMFPIGLVQVKIETHRTPLPSARVHGQAIGRNQTIVSSAISGLWSLR